MRIPTGAFLLSILSIALTYILVKTRMLHTTVILCYYVIHINHSQLPYNIIVENTLMTHAIDMKVLYRDKPHIT